MVFESFVYLISKGALDWGPLQVNLRQQDSVVARTARTTIRKVGTDGRYTEAEPAIAASESGAA